MMDGNRPPGRETRRTGTPPQSTGPDHRHQFDSTPPGAPEGASGEVVPIGHQPQRWLAIQSAGAGSYVVVGDATWWERPIALGTYPNFAEAEDALERFQRQTGLPLFAPTPAPLEPSENAPVAS